MSDKFHWDDTTSVSGDGVTVERELEGRDDGIIVTLDLHKDVSGPLRVDVLDEFPADLPAEQAGFNVQYEPDQGDLSLERAKIRHTIEDESARIVYAIRLSEPVEAVEFEDPSIEDVTLPGLAGSDPTDGGTSGSPSPEADGDQGQGTRGGDGGKADQTDQEADETDGMESPGGNGTEDVPDSGTVASEGGPMAFDSSGFESNVGADRTTETPPSDVDDVEAGSSSAAPDTADEGSDGATADEEGAVDAADEEGADEDRTTLGGSSGPDPAAIERAIAETERSEFGGSDDTTGPGEDTAEDPTDSSGGTAVSGASPDAAVGGSGTPPGHAKGRDAADSAGGGQEATSGPDDPAAAQGGRGTADPASEGRDGPDDRGAADRTHGVAARGPSKAGGAAPDTGDEMSRSVRLRLDRLNARVEEFATYAEALEDIIEREGTGPEIIENLESNLSEANERLEAVRGDVDSLQSEHADDVSAVRDRIESLEDELEAAREDLRTDVVNVRGTVDDIGADVERVDHETSENAADVEEIRDDVGAVSETVDEVAGDVERVDDASAENAEAVEEVREHLETVESAVHSLDERVDDQEDDLDGVTETVESVQADVSELTESVEAMRSEMESLQVDVDRLLRFREILSDVFGGPMQRATEESRDLSDLGEDRPDDSISTPSEPSR